MGPRPRLAGTANAADPFFSPDGQWIGFAADGKLKKISTDGGVPLTLCDETAFRGAAWAEDGSIIAASTTTGLYRVIEGGAAVQPLTKLGPGEATHRWPHILPGGRAVLFTTHSSNSGFDTASIAVVSLDAHETKLLIRGGYFGRYLPTSGAVGHLVYIHQGVLLGVPFDPVRLELRGSPVPLVDDVAGNPTYGGGQFDVSRTGTLVYLRGRASTATWQLAWMDSEGNIGSLRKPGVVPAHVFQ